MCYPKPGPRCSAHAAAAYAKAHQRVLDAFLKDKDDPKLDRLMKARAAAQKEYEITPAAIAKLEASVKTSGYSWDREALLAAKKLRAQRLEAVKGLDEKTHSTRAGKKYLSTVMLEDGEEAVQMPYDHPDLLLSLKDSQRWSESLTDEEHATVAWYSEAGYDEITGYLNNKHVPADSKLTEEDRTQRIQQLDDALSKYKPSETGVVVYRRQLFHENGNLINPTQEHLDETFKPGSVYEPGFFMSTSLNPDNLPTTNNVVSLEILTKTGVPITSVSSQGPREYEFLIPRNAKFKVISNNVQVKRRDGHAKTVESITVVQLQEI